MDNARHSTPGDERIGAKHAQGAMDWTALAARMIDDVARIVHAEIGLFEAALAAQAERFTIDLVLAALLVCGAMCMIAAMILLLRLWVPWWAAFALTGAASMIAAILLRQETSRHVVSVQLENLRSEASRAAQLIRPSNQN